MVIQVLFLVLFVTLKDVEGCQSGDKDQDPAYCLTISDHQCYNPLTETYNYCCSTCSKKKSSLLANCEYGNKDPQYCTTLITETDASQCYDTAKKEYCCATCLLRNTGNYGCEYGNKDPGCEEQIHEDPSICYVNTQCCATCNSVNTNMEDCEYGDHSPEVCGEGKSCCGRAYDCCYTCRHSETGCPNPSQDDRSASNIPSLVVIIAGIILVFACFIQA